MAFCYLCYNRSGLKDKWKEIKTLFLFPVRRQTVYPSVHAAFQVLNSHRKLFVSLFVHVCSSLGQKEKI
jgi:hypothetical protein